MCAAITFGSASCSTSFGGCSPSNASTYILRVDCIPPMPVPWVFANFVGWIQRSSSAGSKPEETNASTVATRFHAASRSTDSVIEPRPHTDGSNPSGIWAPTNRESLKRRGTLISLPARRVTSQSPSSVGVMRVCFGAASTSALASASVRTTNDVSSSRNTDTISGAVPSTSAPSSR